MFKTLSSLLNKPEEFLSNAIGELEELAGFPSEDVRLIAESSLNLRPKMAELGLDPSDTTNEELYQALLARFSNDAKQLDHAVGADSGTSLNEKIDIAIEIVRQSLSDKEVWVLKPTVAKQLLQANPPKKFMKILNYRSAASLIKREHIDEIFLLAAFTELPTWQKAMAKSLATLSSADWMMQPLQIVKLPIDKLNGISGPTSLTTSSSFVGAIALWPSTKLNQTSVLNLSLLLFEVAEELGVTTDQREIYNLHPALNWWSNTTHLIANHNGQPISLNLKDLAASYLQGSDYPNRSMSKGRQSLWSELLRRYQEHISSETEIFSKFSDQLSAGVDKLSHASLPAKLAIEYSEA